MADRWVHFRRVSTLTRGGAFLGQVFNRGPRAWEAWLLTWGTPGPDLGCFPTRAAAMRAVAGKTDPKKGYFAA